MVESCLILTAECVHGKRNIVVYKRWHYDTWILKYQHCAYELFLNINWHNITVRVALIGLFLIYMENNGFA